MKHQPGNTGPQPGNTGLQPGKENLVACDPRAAVPKVTPSQSSALPVISSDGPAFPGNTGPQPGKENDTYKGWHSRGYLPHLDAPALLQSITFRLADSLPQERLRQLEQELATRPDNEREKWKRERIEAWLDAGMGCCALRHPRLAALMQNTLLYFDGSRYRLLAWCVMPNHVHVLIEQQAPLSKIVQSWKSYTGRWALAHAAELGISVPGKRFWMRDYWDRYIRDQHHLNAVIAYIHNNPVKAGLCKNPHEWMWSSAGYGQEMA